MSKLHLGMINSVFKFALLLFVISGITACSTINNAANKVTSLVTGKKASARHDNNKTVKDLEFPPDLTAPEFDKAFELPTGPVTASSMNSVTTTPAYTNTSSVPVQTTAAVAKPRSANLSTIKKQGNDSYLQINDKYERALLLTEIILERMQFKVVNKMLATGEMNVRYQGSNPALVKGGNYRVSVINAQGIPLVRIAKSEGTVLTTAQHAQIISLLNSEFNK
ncbi:hypothetical protein [uncultured Cocleimonas sp.]|uniref:hypothetical protein n=1 Tax=uncultured Cocleimonas sp. TaxID=1051587 RepID=UPI0026366332|nr:hypothetical protein [uncultured Cocleimonas sp.]